MQRFSQPIIRLVAITMLTGCAFDVVSVHQVPAAFTLASASSADDFVLQQPVKILLGTGFPTHLEAGTHWHLVGQTQYGAVYKTQDQIVTVEASNIYEAQLVVENQTVKGFYLPVEKAFAPAKEPVPIKTQPISTDKKP